MKKVRVLKEMPFAKVGEELQVFCVTSIIRIFHKSKRQGAYIEYFEEDIENLLGVWLEWVEEEKSLEEEFINNVACRQVAEFEKEKYGDLTLCPPGPYRIDYEGLAQIAKDHFKKKFDEAEAPVCSECSHSVNCTALYEAMFGEDS